MAPPWCASAAAGAAGRRLGKPLETMGRKARGFCAARLHNARSVAIWHPIGNGGNAKPEATGESPGPLSGGNANQGGYGQGGSYARSATGFLCVRIFAKKGTYYNEEKTKRQARTGAGAVPGIVPGDAPAARSGPRGRVGPGGGHRPRRGPRGLCRGAR